MPNIWEYRCGTKWLISKLYILLTGWPWAGAVCSRGGDRSRKNYSNLVFLNSVEHCGTVKRDGNIKASWVNGIQELWLFLWLLCKPEVTLKQSLKHQLLYRTFSSQLRETSIVQFQKKKNYGSLSSSSLSFTSLQHLIITNLQPLNPINSCSEMPHNLPHMPASTLVIATVSLLLLWFLCNLFFNQE